MQVGQLVEIKAGKRAGGVYAIERIYTAWNGKEMVVLDIPGAPIGHCRFQVTSVREVTR